LDQSGTQQVHDNEPGIMPNGVFWTIPVPSSAVEMRLGEGTARFHMTNLAITDFHDFANSIGSVNPPIPTVPVTVTFDVRWQATKPLAQVRDAVNRFVGEFMHSQATIAWSVEEPAQHFRFQSDPASTSTTVGGVLGRERNGKFFA
jgi:hypothetical protein